MNSKIKSFIKPYYRFCRILWHSNIFKTLYLNFKKLPFSQAFKLPLVVYGNLKIDSIKGDIIINYPIYTGMVKIGYDIDGSTFSSMNTRLLVSGKIIFNGFAVVGKGTVLNIQGNISIGNCCSIGSGSFIKSMECITIGDNTRITYNCTVFDCDMHYVKNIETGIVKNNKAPIYIGANCWINAGTIIGKGVDLPNYSITARNSFLNKNYSEYGNNLFLVGSPAKPLKTKGQRILSTKEERRLEQVFFQENIEEIQCSVGLFDEQDDNEMFFKNLF